jgi:hypothetical protein
MSSRRKQHRLCQQAISTIDWSRWPGVFIRTDDQMLWSSSIGQNSDSEPEQQNTNSTSLIGVLSDSHHVVVHAGTAHRRDLERFQCTGCRNDGVGGCNGGDDVLHDPLRQRVGDPRDVELLCSLQRLRSEDIGQQNITTLNEWRLNGHRSLAQPKGFDLARQGQKAFQMHVCIYGDASSPVAKRS